MLGSSERIVKHDVNYFASGVSFNISNFSWILGDVHHLFFRRWERIVKTLCPRARHLRRQHPRQQQQQQQVQRGSVCPSKLSYNYFFPEDELISSPTSYANSPSPSSLPTAEGTRKERTTNQNVVVVAAKSRGLASVLDKIINLLTEWVTRLPDKCTISRCSRCGQVRRVRHRSLKLGERVKLWKLRNNNEARFRPPYT